MAKAKKILSFLGVVAVAVAVATVATWFAADDTQRDETTRAIESVVAPEPECDEVRQIDWGALPDCVIAWVEIPGTDIDEPIVQATEDYPDYYLYADAFGQGALGTPYIDSACNLESPFVITYGHHMDDGSVFADFARYADVEYARTNQKIFLYEKRDNARHELTVFAADIVNASYEKVKTSYPDQAMLDALVADIARSADVVLFELNGTEQIFAFSTCSYQTWNSRTIVYAIEEGVG